MCIFNSDQPPVIVQLDCDGESVISNYYGYDREKDDYKDRIYPELSCFLDIFKSYGIKATLFVIGKDIVNEEKRELLQRAVIEGHELGNHTYTHPKAFGCLGQQNKQLEIARTQDALSKYLGISAFGFRAPNYELDHELIEILKNLGFVYDSSMLPTIFSPFLKFLRKLNNFTFGIKESKIGYLGSASFFMAPRYPFTPSEKWTWKQKRNEIDTDKFFEVPVITSPILKLPYHASYALASAEKFRYLFSNKIFNWYYEKKLPLVYPFHLCDICDSTYLYNTESKMYGSQKARFEFVNWVCSELVRNFRSVTTIEYLREINSIGSK